MEVEDEIIYLSEEDINAIIGEINTRLGSITIDDIEVDNERGTYYVEDEEVEISAIEGLMAYVNYDVDYWYREWTETWYDPYCTPSFSEGGINDVWCGVIELVHDEYEINDAEAIAKRIQDTIYAQEKSVYDARIERKRLARERKLAKERELREARKQSLKVS